MPEIQSKAYTMYTLHLVREVTFCVRITDTLEGRRNIFEMRPPVGRVQQEVAIIQKSRVSPKGGIRG